MYTYIDRYHDGRPVDIGAACHTPSGFDIKHCVRVDAAYHDRYGVPYRGRGALSVSFMHYVSTKMHPIFLYDRMRCLQMKSPF